MEEHDNKKRTAVWLTPGVIRRMDSWLEEDNCKTRSEFIEKALRFYMGYLATEDTSEYLSRALVDTLRGILADNENRLRTLLFKLCVEVNMMGHTVAAHFRADPVNRRELRAYAWTRCCAPTGRSVSMTRWISSARSTLTDEPRPVHVPLPEGRPRHRQAGQPGPLHCHPPRRGGAQR